MDISTRRVVVKVMMFSIEFLLALHHVLLDPIPWHGTRIIIQMILIKHMEVLFLYLDAIQKMTALYIHIVPCCQKIFPLSVSYQEKVLFTLK